MSQAGRLAGDPGARVVSVRNGTAGTFDRWAVLSGGMLRVTSRPANSGVADAFHVIRPWSQ